MRFDLGFSFGSWPGVATWSLPLTTRIPATDCSQGRTVCRGFRRRPPTRGIQVFDTLRALDYLMTRGDVDPGRIGVCGLCQGAGADVAGRGDRRAIPSCGAGLWDDDLFSWVRMPVAARPRAVGPVALPGRRASGDRVG